MERSHPPRRAVRFGVFVADFLSGELRQNGHRIKIQEQPFQVLAALLERPGEIVTREELRRRLWLEEDTFVDFDHGLRTAILKLREALEDDADHPRFIETVPRHGYRFIAPVEVVPPEVEAGIEAAPEVLNVAGAWAQKRSIFALVAAAIIAALALGIALNVAGVRDRLLGHSGAIRSVAVLPFNNAQGNPDVEYLSDGITENLINSLSSVPNLRVVPRSLAFEFKGKKISPQAAGKQLKVEAVVTGRVMVHDSTLTVGTEIMDLASVSQLWGKQYSRKTSDLIGLEETIAQDITTRLRLTSRQRSALAPVAATDPEAYLLYLRSRQLGRAFWLPESVKKSAEYARQAVEKDPQFALGYAGLADAYSRMGLFDVLPPVEAFPRAKEAALKALELNGNIAEAHASLARVKLFYDWDLSGAGAEYRRAVELKPDDAELHERYGRYLMYAGRAKESLAEGHRAHELNPLSATILASLAESYIAAREDDKAIEVGKKAIELDPHCGRAYAYISAAYFIMGQYDQSNAYYLRQLRELGASVEEIARARKEYQTLGIPGAMRLTLQREEARLARGERGSMTSISMGYAMINEREKALACLEKAFRVHDPHLVMIINGGWNSLRSDPRFQDLLRRMNFPPEKQ
jgi:TolB-like protein/DNA-binding winged helix-turn-helix (wHTH) protein